jgi:hypothetical protein
VCIGYVSGSERADSGATVPGPVNCAADASSSTAADSTRPAYGAPTIVLDAMPASADDQWPDLPPDATLEQIVQRGRDLHDTHNEMSSRLKEIKGDLAEAIEKAEADGYAESEAATIAEAKENLAAIRVLVASVGERNELGRQIAREKGYEI